MGRLTSMESRRAHILRSMFPEGRSDLGAAHLCGVCAQVTGTAGAGIMLISGDLDQSLVCASDAVSARIEELQFTMGEGPCLDVCHQRGPVSEPDLANATAGRWMGFTAPALEAGVRALFVYGLRVGAMCFGALYLYSDHPGVLSSGQHADALALADLAAEAVLSMQANAPGDSLATELATGANMRSVVHQAAGMISVQLDVSVTQALIRLRAHAFGTDCAVGDVAELVVTRRLSFQDERPFPAAS